MSRKRPNIVQADTPEGQRAGEALIEVVENQLRERDPPEVSQALKRLLALGETRENAIRYIACALSIEVYETLRQGTQYDHERYKRNLDALPDLPDDPSDDI
jgi:hypothetical protein